MRRDITPLPTPTPGQLQNSGGQGAAFCVAITLAVLSVLFAGALLLAQTSTYPILTGFWTWGQPVASPANLPTRVAAGARSVNLASGLIWGWDGTKWSSAFEGTHGDSYAPGRAEETITFSTSGTTSTGTGNLFPGGSFEKFFACRILTTIATATAYTIGDGTTADRFASTGGALTAGTVIVGVNFRLPNYVGTTNAKSAFTPATAQMVWTFTGTPSAGSARCVSYYDLGVGPAN